MGRRVAMGVLSLLGLLSCGNGHVANAVIGTAIGLSASAVSRSGGGCYSACVTGTTCNPDNGLCEPLPCRGQCAEGERCDELTQACVKSSVPPRIVIGREQRPVESRDYWEAAQ